MEKMAAEGFIDAALEGGYVLYRISRKDGSVLEGFMQNKDDRGTTLRFMGGAQLFVDAADIQSERYIGGRSVMPKTLVDGLPDDQFANLLAYIRTLK